MRILALAACGALVACGTPSPEMDAGIPEGDCPALNGNTTSHTTDITADETWAGDGTVHTIDFGITVRPGGTLTLAPCAVVKIAPGLIISVAGDEATAKVATLQSLGTVKRPVVITRKDSTKAWGMLRALAPVSRIDLQNTTLEGGGDGTTPMLVLRGSSNRLAIDTNLNAINLTLKGAGNQSLVLERGAAFSTTSANLTITGGGPAAGTVSGDLELTPRAINSLPAVVTISGNNQNVIKVSDQLLQIERDLTLRNLGVPYHFYFDRVRVHSSTASPRLTIEAGTEVRFDDYLMIGSATGMGLEETGTLMVKGTTSQPVTFTSSKPTHLAGEWPGLYLRAAQGSKLNNLRINAAGGFNGISSANCKPGSSSDNAALFIGGQDSTYVPAADDFFKVEIRDSKSHGINAMWEASSFGPDLSAGFVFGTINGCRQTKNARNIGCGTEAGCLVQ